MTTTITIDTGDRRRAPVVVLGPDDPPGVARIEVPDPVPPPRPPLRIGVHATPKEYTLWYTKMPNAWFARVFFQPGKGLPLWTGADAGGLKTLPASIIRHVSYKDQVGPAGIRAHLDSKPPGVPEWLTWHHEGDLDWAGDVAGYRNYWRLLRAVVDDHPERDNITLINVHTGYASRFKRHLLDWRWFMLPDQAHVDSWDDYRLASVDAYEDPVATLAQAVQAHHEFGVRSHLTEVGTHRASWDTTGEQQARWYQESVGVADEAGFEAVGFYCAVDGAYDYRPLMPATMQVWQELLALHNTTPNTVAVGAAAAARATLIGG